MEDSIRIVFLSVLIMVFGILIGFTFYYVKNAEVINDSADETVTDLSVNILEQKYTKYNGTELNGTDVVNAIEELQDEVAIKVVLEPGNDLYTQVYNKHNTELPDTRISPYWINPADQFRGTLIRNSDSTVIGIKFERMD